MKTINTNYISVINRILYTEELVSRSAYTFAVGVMQAVQQ